MSPTLGQTLPQDPTSAHEGQTLPQDPASAHDPIPTDTHHQPKESKCKEEGVATPKLEQKQYDVKEERESPTAGNAETFQVNQSSQGRSSDPSREVYYQGASRGRREAPWIYVMNELRSVQHAVELPRSRVDGEEAPRDAMALREGLDNLDNRIGSIEENVGMNRLCEAQGRIVRLEESVSQVDGSLRECHARVNCCEAGRQKILKIR